jgi:hypothetical protein
VCPVTSVKIVMDAFARLLDLNARNYDIKCWAEMKAPVGCALSSCILSTHSGAAFGWSLPLIFALGACCTLSSTALLQDVYHSAQSPSKLVPIP